VKCYGNNDGAASISVSGGTVPYSYNWNPGGNNTPSISSLVSGNYNVTVTDNNGCNTNTQIAINQPGQLKDSSATTGTACGQSNGTVTLFVNGGSQPYNYSWSPGGF